MIPASAQMPFYPPNTVEIPINFRFGGALVDVSASTFEWRIRNFEESLGDEIDLLPTATDVTDAAEGRVVFSFDLSAEEAPVVVRLKENGTFDDWMMVLRLQPVWP